VVVRTALGCCLLVFAFFASGNGDQPGEKPEFYFTRLQYSAGGPAARSFRAWYTDSPAADHKFMWGIRRMTNARVYEPPDLRDVQSVKIMDPDLFKYPYIYAVEPGQMELSAEEAARLREYLLRGGFWHCDDFWGLEQFDQLERQLRKIFPDRTIVDLPLTHEVFHTFFDIDRVLQVPNVRFGEEYTRSGGTSRTWEQASDTEPRVMGISDDKGRLMVLITYNSDLGDAWEWMDDPEYPALFTGYAYRLGMNSIVYAMTH
jgi:hypothetical protein